MDHLQPRLAVRGVSQAIIRNVISRVRRGHHLFHDSGALIRNEGGDRATGQPCRR